MMAEFSSSRDTVVNYKVYIAGQYAPAQSVDVQQGIFTFCQARVTLFPHKELVNLGEGDRVPIQIFYLDTFHGQKAQYRLIYDGEIVSDGYYRGASSIGMTISSVSPFEILSQMFKEFFEDMTQHMNSSSNVNPIFSELNLGALLGDSLVSRIGDSNITKDTTYDKFFSLDHIRGKKKEDKSSMFMRRPFTLFKNIIIDLMHGVNAPQLQTSVSLFFKSFLSKRDIAKMMYASPILESKEIATGDKSVNVLLSAVDRVLSTSVITNSVSKLMTLISGSRNISFWDMVVRAYSILMYEVTFPLCPPYVRSNIYSVPTETVTSNDYFGIVHLLTKPSLYFGVPPKFNCVFPSMIQSISYTNDHLTEPTRSFVGNPSSIQRIIEGNSSQSNTNSPMSKLLALSSSAFWPKDLLYKTDASGKKVELKPNEIQKNLLWDLDGKYAEFFKGAVSYNVPQAPAWVNYINKENNKNQDVESKDSGEVESVVNSDAVAEDMLNSIEVFIHNEFEKEKSSRKTISLELRYNPYLIAGFPTVIVDNLNYGTYFLGIIQSVSHTLGVDSASTTITVGSVTTFKDAYSNNVGKHTVGPDHPSPQVAAIFNDATQSSVYYKEVFYQGEVGDSYVFNPEEFFILDDDKDIDIGFVEGKSTKKPGIINDALDILYDFDTTMKFVSRPVTTMTNYLEFKKSHVYMDSDGNSNILTSISNQPTGGVTSIGSVFLFNGTLMTKEISERSDRKVINTESDIPKDVPIYYSKILGYTYLKQELNSARIFSQRPTDLTNYPDFIDNWPQKIQTYREDVLNIMRDFYIG